MKVRVTLITENDKPVSMLGENPEIAIKRAWDLVLAMLSLESKDPSDRAFVENVEIIGEGNNS